MRTSSRSPWKRPSGPPPPPMRNGSLRVERLVQLVELDVQRLRLAVDVNVDPLGHARAVVGDRDVMPARSLRSGSAVSTRIASSSQRATRLTCSLPPLDRRSSSPAPSSASIIRETIVPASAPAGRIQAASEKASK